MFQHEDFWLPDGEQQWLFPRVADYQRADREEAYEYVRDWTVALDVGANIGIFSRAFAGRFRKVVAFEPIPGIRECLERNVPANVTVQPYAVSDQPGRLIMRQVVKSSGGSFIANHPDIAVPSKRELSGPRAIPVDVRTIDSFGFDNVGLIKMDIQGAEYLALKGAEETIRRCRPVMMVEEKPREGDALDMENCRRASEFLLSLGMVAKSKRIGDRVYVFEG
jgi:FkbM family methyltransferase